MRHNICGNSGGGAYGSVLVDCVLDQNAVDQQEFYYYERFGGGAAYSSLERCRIIGNTAEVGAGTAFCDSRNSIFSGKKAAIHGGADFAGSLRNCTLIHNEASQAGGASESLLYNCIVYYNIATNAANHGSCGVYYSCTPDVPANSVGGSAGNITSPPLLSGYALSSISPGINSGNNAYVTSTTDYFGHPRISKGTVDIGAQEFQEPLASMSYDWLRRYGLPLSENTDESDADLDGATVMHEWLADTNPTNSVSVLKLVPLSLGDSNCVSFLTSTNRTYDVLYAAPAEELTWNSLPGWSAFRGSGGIMMFTDTNSASSRLYRIRARLR